MRKNFEKDTLPSELSRFFKSLRPVYLKFGETRHPRVKTKEGGSLVSALDWELNDKINRFLKKIASYPVISEETITGSWPPPQEDFWLIDPLDGTHNFLAGLPIFGTMIVLVQNSRPTFSAIFLPAKEILSGNGFYWAAKGGKAWQLQGNKKTRITVSKTRGLATAFLLIEGSAKRALKSLLIRKAIGVAQRVRDSLSFCWSTTSVASGGNHRHSADALISYKNKPWDNLPGCLLVEEASGKVTDYAGRPWSLENCSSLIFSNGRLHNEILALLKK